MAGRLDQRIHLSPRQRLANATKRRPTMNDPEIIRKLEEIREELSGIKDEINWLPKFCIAVFWGSLIGGGVIYIVIEKLVEWLF